MQQHLLPVLCSLILLCSVTSAIVVTGGVDNIMSCMFCEIVTEAFENESTPAGVVQSMFKKCNRMGLMEPVCDHFVSTNAKKIFVMAKSGIPSVEICEKLALCDETRR